MGTSTSSIGHSSGMQTLLSIQRQEVEQEFPETAAKGLAFHVFYINNEKDNVEIQLPVARNEVDIDNLQSCVRAWHRHHGEAQGCSDLHRDLSKTETDRIVELALDATNHVGLLQTINAQMPKLPLCPAKVTALRIVKRVTQGWIDRADLEPPILDKIQTANELNDRSLAATVTDYYLLQENGLLSTSTALPAAAAKLNTAATLVSIGACATSQSDMDIEASDMRVQWHTPKDSDIASSQSSA
ncbi:hypothetical protein AAVH_03097 [Aphelenchoides avenae]|nr:hypothetical protein AAVH_03097 [Aphelenchus avenae]